MNVSKNQQFPVWHLKWQKGVRFEKRRDAIGGNIVESKRPQKEALSKAPEERAVPSKRTQSDTSSGGASCPIKTGRSYGTLASG